MQGDKLTLEFDQNDRIVWLVFERDRGIRHQEAIWLRDGFGLEDVAAAVLATGWAQQCGDAMRMVDDIRGTALRDVVQEMLTYFDAPGIPRPELLDVQVAVQEYQSAQNVSLEIPLLAYAWLDVMVRQALADEARSAGDIWSRRQLVIECGDQCDRLVAKLFSRYAHPRKMGTAVRMAPSTTTRSANQASDRTG